MRHLYVHIPFCRSRCAYCDFASEPIGPPLRSGRVDAYVQRLRMELQERAGVRGDAWAGDGTAGTGEREQGDSAAEAGSFDTIYVGGGTPTVLPDNLLLQLVGELACLQKGVTDREFTVEANPGTIGPSLLAGLVEAGITRLSLGVQSFAPRLRGVLGRHTTQAEIEEALQVIAASAGSAGEATSEGRSAPLEWNLDLVFGIPRQDWAEAAADIDRAIAAGPHHISLYDLTYTPAFAARVARTAGSGARRAAGAFAEEHLGLAAAKLESAGYKRYEVSNFALPGHECRHNQAYWRGEDYLGVGAAAVSTAGDQRRTNPRSVVAYLADEEPTIEGLTPRVRLWERAMLGLRTAEGVEEAEVLSVLDSAARDRLLEQDCLERRCGRLRLNPAFLDVSNAVISTLLAAPEGS